jgi:hypothetical protein
VADRRQWNACQSQAGRAARATQERNKSDAEKGELNGQSLAGGRVLNGPSEECYRMAEALLYPLNLIHLRIRMAL